MSRASTATGGLDLLLVTGPLDELGRARLRHGTRARVGARVGDGGAPCFGRDDLGALRELALAHVIRTG